MRATASRDGLVQSRVRRVPVPSLVVACASVLAALAGALLLTVGDGWSVPGAHEVPVDLAVALAHPLTGLLVLSGPRSARLLGRLLVGVGAASAVTVATTAVAATATAATGPVIAAAWVQSWSWVPAFLPLLTLLPLLYPDGRLLSPRWRPVAAAAVVGTVLVTVAMALYDEPFVGHVRVPEPFTAVEVTVPLGIAGASLLLAAALGALVSIVLRLRRSTGLARRQVVVLGLAAGVLAVEAFLHRWLPADVERVTQVAAVVLLPLAVGVAVTRHRLYDLDVALLRTLVGISLAASLAGVYLTVVTVLSAALPDDGLWASAAAAGITGLLVQPLGTRLARSADRFWYGDRADPYAVLSALSSRLREGVAPQRVPEAVCRAVVEALRLGGARLVLGADPSARPVAGVGAQTGLSEGFPLRHRGALVGHLQVELRPGEQRLDGRDRELLVSLCDQAAPALAALALTEQLRRSRDQLVSGREEERRRLRRDLHDGIGAALSGARLQLESARELVDDPRVVRMLDAAGRAVVEAVTDVRRLTEDLRPPALDELGLIGSLRGLAERVRMPALEVSVQLAPAPPLPAAVEVACYRITAEALNNAARHAGARAVVLRLEAEDDAVLVEVRDDGQGIPAQRATDGSGLGLDSMRRRAEEVGGALTVLSDAEGTTVRAWLPLAPG